MSESEPSTSPGNNVRLIKTLTAIVHPWLCDSFEHLNTRHYLGMFDDATHVVGVLLGYRHGSDRGWADVRNELDYLSECRQGSVIEIHSGIAKVGTKSLTIVSEMRSFDGLTVHARMRAVVVRFDLKGRCAIAIEEEIRTKAHLIGATDSG